MKVTKLIWKNIVWIMLLCLCILFSLMSPNFLTTNNLITVLRQTAVTGILCVGLAIVIIGGEIDLSIGRQMGLTGVVCALLISKGGMNPILAMVLSLMVNLGIGLLNGVIITYTGMPAMIATIGMQFACYGAANLLCGGYPIYGMPPVIKVLGQGYIGVIPVCVIVLVIVIAIGAFVLTKTHFGRQVFAVGSNAEAAHLSGINVERTKILLYIISGFAAGLAGLVLMSRVNSGQPTNGANFEMNALIACVVGGISFAGGAGKISGIVGGMLVMSVLANGMAVAGMSEYSQTLVKGIVLIAVVAADCLSRKRKSKAM